MRSLLKANSALKSLSILLSVVMLNACSGSGETENASPAPAPAPTPSAPSPQNPGIGGPTPGDGGDSINTTSSQVGSVFSNYEELSLDQDKDGLPDDIDSAPSTPLIETAGSSALSVDFIASNIDSQLYQNSIVAGASIQGKIANSHLYTAPFYLLSHSETAGGVAQINAIQIVLDETGSFTTEFGETLPTAISVAAQGYSSEPLVVKAYPANAPLLMAPTADIFTNEVVELSGTNLNNLAELWLGNTKLSYSIGEYSTSIKINLPSIATTNQLTIVSSEHKYDQTIPLKRRITLSADDTIIDANSWWALTNNGKLLLTPENIYPLSRSEIILPVSANVSDLRFYHDQYRSVDAVIWPDTQHVVFGSASTLEKNVVTRLSSLFGAEQLDSLKQLVQYNVKQYLDINTSSTLHDLHNQAISTANENDLQVALESILGLMASANHNVLTHLNRASLATPISGTQGVFDYLDDTFASVFASNVMYEPIMSVSDLRSKPGDNSYSGMKIGLYRNLSVCLGLESVNAPSGLWPSDLCARNTGVYFASLKVTNPVSKQVLKKHVKEYLDTGMIGATGWGILSLSQIAYITSDTGTPLCHMQPCKLEFLTGGLGVGTNVSLTKAQRTAQQIVLGRTMLERVVLPILGEAMGIAADQDQTARCLVSHIVLKAPPSLVSYGTMIADYKKKVDAASKASEVATITLETVVKYAYDVAAGMLATGSLPKCLPEALRKDASANLSKRVGEFAEKVAVPLRYANIATTAMQGFEAITTPEKFTFSVAPRAAITSMTTSSSTDDVPELFSNVDTNTLRIRGTKFVYLKSDNTNYWPKLRLRDRSGQTQTLQLNESHKVNIADLSWVDIAIPVSDLKPLMKKLRGDIINVSIIMDDVDYSDFPGGVLPVLGRDIRWVGQPKVFNARPSIVRTGRLITIQGKNLQSFINRSDLKLRIIDANDPTQTAQIFKVESSSDSQVKFRLPSTVVPPDIYKLRLETSDPSLQLDVPDDVSQGSATGAIRVIPNDASLLQLYDSGAKLDDNIYITVTDANNNLILKDGASIRIEIPPNSAVRARYVYWQNTNLTAQNNGSTVPGGLEIGCDAGGTDQICTYRVIGEVNANGTFKSVRSRGKIKPGEFKNITY